MRTTTPRAGVLNRRGLTAELRRAHARARRDGTALSVLLLDVDRFKKLNDEHGHQAGDTALRQIARALAGETRTGDLLGRLGGDEFLVIAPATDAAAAAVVAERLRRLELPRLALGPGVEVTVTLSLGTASLRPDETVDALIERADQDMYQHKRRA